MGYYFKFLWPFLNICSTLNHCDKIVDEQDIEDVDPGLVDHRQGDYKAAPERSQNPYFF